MSGSDMASPSGSDMGSMMMSGSMGSMSGNIWNYFKISEHNQNSYLQVEIFFLFPPSETYIFCLSKNQQDLYTTGWSR